MSSEKSREQIWQEWRELVNLAPAELEKWLATERSHTVGDNREGDSTGHQSGRRIVAIKRTNKDDLTEDQWAHMASVVGYIKRHLAQGGPEHDSRDSAWRHSLMNWGHDPMKGQ